MITEEQSAALERGHVWIVAEDGDHVLEVVIEMHFASYEGSRAYVRIYFPETQGGKFMDLDELYVTREEAEAANRSRRVGRHQRRAARHTRRARIRGHLLMKRRSRRQRLLQQALKAPQRDARRRSQAMAALAGYEWDGTVVKLTTFAWFKNPIHSGGEE